MNREFKHERSNINYFLNRHGVELIEHFTEYEMKNEFEEKETSQKEEIQKYFI